MERNQMKIAHGSLFSGFDAPSVAASWMGWENSFHCEINPFCNEILKYWFPNSEHYEDITKTDFRQWKGKIDVLTGGFPCQPFSLAGQRKGADDNRYLWPHMLRAIREIRPAWVIGENVAGILTMVQPGEEVEVGSQATLFGEDNRKRILLRQEYVVETICKDLEREGYFVQPLLIPACAVGAPHRRDRVWFVAHSDSKRHTSCGTCEESERCRCGNNGESKKWKQSSEWSDGFHGFPRNASHSYGKRCDHRSDNRGERYIYCHQEWNSAQDKSEWAEWKCRIGEDSADVADTHGKLPLYGNGKMSERRETERFPIEPSDFQTCWQAFPTQSPVCRGNDGLPFDVDDLTIPFTKWRQESIKGYGNAIVPQVIIEIFKAIEEIEQST